MLRSASAPRSNRSDRNRRRSSLLGREEEHPDGNASAMDNAGSSKVGPFHLKQQPRSFHKTNPIRLSAAQIRNKTVGKDPPYHSQHHQRSPPEIIAFGAVLDHFVKGGNIKEASNVYKKEMDIVIENTAKSNQENYPANNQTRHRYHDHPTSPLTAQHQLAKQQQRQRQRQKYKHATPMGYQQQQKQEEETLDFFSEDDTLDFFSGDDTSESDDEDNDTRSEEDETRLEEDENTRFVEDDEDDTRFLEDDTRFTGDEFPISNAVLVKLGLLPKENDPFESNINSPSRKNPVGGFCQGSVYSEDGTETLLEHPPPQFLCNGPVKKKYISVMPRSPAAESDYTESLPPPVPREIVSKSKDDISALHTITSGYAATVRTMASVPSIAEATTSTRDFLNSEDAVCTIKRADLLRVIAGTRKAPSLASDTPTSMGIEIIDHQKKPPLNPTSLLKNPPLPTNKNLTLDEMLKDLEQTAQNELMLFDSFIANLNKDKNADSEVSDASVNDALVPQDTPSKCEYTSFVKMKDGTVKAVEERKRQPCGFEEMDITGYDITDARDTTSQELQKQDTALNFLDDNSTICRAIEATVEEALEECKRPATPREFDGSLADKKEEDDKNAEGHTNSDQHTNSEKANATYMEGKIECVASFASKSEKKKKNGKIPALMQSLSLKRKSFGRKRFAKKGCSQKVSVFVAAADVETDAVKGKGDAVLSDASEENEQEQNIGENQEMKQTAKNSVQATEGIKSTKSDAKDIVTTTSPASFESPAPATVMQSLLSFVAQQVSDEMRLIQHAETVEGAEQSNYQTTEAVSPPITSVSSLLALVMCNTQSIGKEEMEQVSNAESVNMEGLSLKSVQQSSTMENFGLETTWITPMKIQEISSHTQKSWSPFHWPHLKKKPIPKPEKNESVESNSFVAAGSSLTAHPVVNSTANDPKRCILKTNQSDHLPTNYIQGTRCKPLHVETQNNLLEDLHSTCIQGTQGTKIKTVDVKTQTKGLAQPDSCNISPIETKTDASIEWNPFWGVNIRKKKKSLQEFQSNKCENEKTQCPKEDLTNIQNKCSRVEEEKNNVAFGETPSMAQKEEGDNNNNNNTVKRGLIFPLVRRANTDLK